MPADREDLRRRIEATAEADTSRGLNFNTLFALVRDLAGEDAARACDPDGKAHRVDFFSYPVASYLAIAWAAADRLEARLGSVDAVFEELGRRTVTGFLASVIGKTVFAMAGRDPHKIVAAGPAGYKTAVSYGERSVVWLDDRHARMIFRRDFMPPVFHAAVIRTALQSTEARDVRVFARATGFLEAEYDVSWS